MKRRALMCALSSPGFLFPLIGIAKKLSETGFVCEFVTGLEYDELLAREGFRRVPRDSRDGPSFEVARWGFPLHVAMQMKHLEHALGEGAADVLVTNQLAMGPLLIAERHRIPVVVLGLAAYLYPTPNEDSDESRRRTRYNYFETLKIYNSVRALTGFKPLPETVDVNPFLGDVFLLQSVPELYGHTVLPENVRFIGAASWEPEPAGGEPLRAPCEGPAYYLQPGRTFDDADPWPHVSDVLADEGVTVYVSLGRSQSDLAERPNFVAKRFLSQDSVLPLVDGVISAGHTTSVLGAIMHGKPLLLLPNGSGTYDIAHLLERAGVATALQSASVAEDAGSFRSALRTFRAAGAMREAAASLQQKFARFAGAREGAGHVAGLLN